MKILIIHRNSFDVIGGVEGTLYYMAEAIKSMGHTPIIVAKQKGTNSAAKEQTDVCLVRRYRDVHIPKLLLPFSPVFECRNAMRYLKEIVLEEIPDLVIVRDSILSYVVSQFYDNKKIVYVPLGVIKYYNSSRHTSSLKGFLIERIRRINLRFESGYQIKAFLSLKNTAVFSQNMNKQVYSATKGRVSPKVIYPGVSRHFLDYRRSEFDFSAWKANPVNKNFLFVGRLAQEKNLRMLIKAFSRMKNTNSNLWIVGDGPEMANLKSLAEQSNLSDRIIFTGSSRETVKFYHMADFFVLPSYYESFGNVIIESLASGTPVIGFKTEPGKTLTAVEELIDDGKTGIICKNFSEDALAEALNEARNLCEDIRYPQMRADCIGAVENRFTWEKFITNIFDLVQQQES